MLTLIIFYQFKRLAKYYRCQRTAKIFTSLMFLVVFAGLAVGLYHFFVTGFNFIKIQDEFQSGISLPLSLYFYELLLAILGGVIIFSSLITGLFALFRKNNDFWLLASPGYRYHPRAVFLKIWLNGLWPLLIVFLPFSLALNKVYQLSTTGMLLVGLSFIIYLLLLTGLSLVAIILTGYVLGKLKLFRLTFGWLLSVLLLIIMVVSTVVWQISIKNDVVKLFRFNRVAAPTVELESIANLFVYLPGHPLAMTIIHLQADQTQPALISFTILLILSGLLLLIWWVITPIFLPLWQTLQENTNPTKAGTNNTRRHQSRPFPNGKIAALFRKELLVNRRENRGLLWFVFLLFIWLMQLAVNSVLANNIKNYQLDPELGLAILPVLQFVTAIFFSAAFVLRFVFPAFSTESRTAWILGTAPLDFKKVFWAKYIFYAPILSLINTVFAYFGLAGLPLNVNFTLLAIILFLVSVFFITGLGLSLGAIFPNLETDDPAVISTTLPGLGLIFLSLIYGAAGGWIIYATFTTASLLPLSLYIILSILITVFLIISVPKYIKNKTLLKETIS